MGMERWAVAEPAEESGRIRQGLFRFAHLCPTFDLGITFLVAVSARDELGRYRHALEEAGETAAAFNRIPV